MYWFFEIYFKFWSRKNFDEKCWWIYFIFASLWFLAMTWTIKYFLNLRFWCGKEKLVEGEILNYYLVRNGARRQASHQIGQSHGGNQVRRTVAINGPTGFGFRAMRQESVRNITGDATERRDEAVNPKAPLPYEVHVHLPDHPHPHSPPTTAQAIRPWLLFHNDHSVFREEFVQLLLFMRMERREMVRFLARPGLCGRVTQERGENAAVEEDTGEYDETARHGVLG